MKRIPFAAFAAVLALALAAPAAAAPQSRTLKPSFASPRELSDMLGATEYAGAAILRWTADGAEHLVTLRRNDAANLLVLEGEAADLDRVSAQAALFDVAPRQIALEARVIEVDTDATRELGFDWNVYGDAYARWSAANLRERSAYSTRSSSSAYEYASEVARRSTARVDEERATADARASFRMLEQSGAVTYRDTPRILTLNNRPATILDGQRTTYVTRYAAYTNLFETETMDSGLRMQVTPSLGEGGHLRLGLQVELTRLDGYLSGSPVKTGQIVENTVMAKDGETVVLGGFTRTYESKSVRRLPVLGRVLPWLFARESTRQRHSETLVVITPRVVDLAGALAPREKELLEGR
jgi:general secretion pathway protein D